MKEENDENLCADYDEEDCRYAFVYYFDKDYKVHVRAQEERECPPKVRCFCILQLFRRTVDGKSKIGETKQDA